MGVLPQPRGAISELLLGALVREPHELAAAALPAIHEPLEDDDLHLSLYLCYELHYRGLPGVDERWEWDPSLLAFRAVLEDRFEVALLEAVPVDQELVAANEIDRALRNIAEED